MGMEAWRRWGEVELQQEERMSGRMLLQKLQIWLFILPLQFISLWNFRRLSRIYSMFSTLLTVELKTKSFAVKFKFTKIYFFLDRIHTLFLIVIIWLFCS